jgi:hypothetical protein
MHRRRSPGSPLILVSNQLKPSGEAICAVTDIIVGDDLDWEQLAEGEHSDGLISDQRGLITCG